MTSRRLSTGPSTIIRRLTGGASGPLAGLSGSCWAAPAWAQPGPPAGSNGGGSPPVSMTDIHGIKSALPMGPDLDWLPWLAATLALAAAVAFLGLWLWRRRKKAIEPPAAPPLPPPEVEAIAQLDRLAADGHPDQRLFYFRLSAILRRYIERRYGFPAAEMTTEELLPRLGRLTVDADIFQQLKGFCLRADPVKFAGAAAEPDQLAGELTFGREFVRRTTPADSDEEAAQIDEVRSI